ncbi:MAG: hypothetical protein ACRCYY_05970 [Trueperaceae bacterium]
MKKHTPKTTKAKSFKPKKIYPGVAVCLEETWTSAEIRKAFLSRVRRVL